MLEVWGVRAKPSSQMDQKLAENIAELQDVSTASAVQAARCTVIAARTDQEIEQVLASVQNVTHNASELNSQLEKVATISKQTAEASDQASQAAAEGQKLTQANLEVAQALNVQMKETYDLIHSLIAQIQGIMKISQTIQDISFQIKLLSFNAAVEAARAGDHGRGFSVVAQEVNNLGQHTTSEAQSIASLIQTINQSLGPAQTALEKMKTFVGQSHENSVAVNESFHEIVRLIEQTSVNTEAVARSTQEQTELVRGNYQQMLQASQSCAQVKAHSSELTNNMQALTQVTEKSFVLLGNMNVDTLFNRMLSELRSTSQRVETLFDQLVVTGRCRLEDILAFEYNEIRGASQIAKLGRLFDVSKVGPQGFTPPKYSTAYDELIDAELQNICEELLLVNPKITLALFTDINGYAPIHNRSHTQAWTGDPTKDLVGNRAKRIFDDHPSLIRAIRVGLGSSGRSIPLRQSYQQFRANGVDLSEKTGDRDVFLAQTYARDTGEIMSVLSVPVFVRGQRLGSLFVGWTP